MYAVGVNDGLWRRCDFRGGSGVRVGYPDEANTVVWRGRVCHVADDVVFDAAEAGECAVDCIEVVLPAPREFDCPRIVPLGLRAGLFCLV